QITSAGYSGPYAETRIAVRIAFLSPTTIMSGSMVRFVIQAFMSTLRTVPFLIRTGEERMFSSFAVTDLMSTASSRYIGDSAGYTNPLLGSLTELTGGL